MNKLSIANRIINKITSENFLIYNEKPHSFNEFEELTYKKLEELIKESKESEESEESEELKNNIFKYFKLIYLLDKINSLLIKIKHDIDEYDVIKKLIKLKPLLDELNKIENLKINEFDDINKLINQIISHSHTIEIEGGKKSKKLPKKEILGKMRCIYKIPGDKKKYLKHKGKLITVKEYKELMKAKPKKVKKTKSKK